MDKNWSTLCLGDNDFRLSFSPTFIDINYGIRTTVRVLFFVFNLYNWLTHAQKNVKNAIYLSENMRIHC